MPLSQPDAPRDDLIREFGFASTPARSATRADSDGDGPPILVGYAAVFNSPTRIDSWEGTFDEVISPGAFKKTLQERSPVLQFDHGRHPMIGSLPIGRFDRLAEDTRGVYVEAELFESAMLEPLVLALRGDTIGGMSFRMRVIREEWDLEGDVPLRTILEVACPELGPVVFPAYPDTEVGVRSLLATATPEEVRDTLNKLCTPTGAAPSRGTPDGAAGAPTTAHTMTTEERSALLARIRKVQT